jgi:hypothetical protein
MTLYVDSGNDKSHWAPDYETYSRPSAPAGSVGHYIKWLGTRISIFDIQLLVQNEKCPVQSWIWAVCWRSQEAQSFGIVSAFTELVKPLFNCPELSEAQQIDVIKKIETPDLRRNDLHILEGDPLTLFKNIGTRSEFTKGRRCDAIQMRTEQWFFNSRTVKPWHWRKLPWRKLQMGWNS